MKSARVRVGLATLTLAAGGTLIVQPAFAENYYPGGIDGVAITAAPAVMSPDDRRGSSRGAPDLVDRAVAREKARAAASQRGDEAFDWGAAGIGASTSAVILSMLAVALFLTRRLRTGSVVA
jgi:hypothetical protein